MRSRCKSSRTRRSCKRTSMTTVKVAACITFAKRAARPGHVCFEPAAALAKRIIGSLTRPVPQRGDRRLAEAWLEAVVAGPLSMRRRFNGDVRTFALSSHTQIAFVRFLRPGGIGTTVATGMSGAHRKQHIWTRSIETLPVCESGTPQRLRAHAELYLAATSYEDVLTTFHTA